MNRKLILGAVIVAGLAGCSAVNVGATAGIGVYVGGPRLNIVLDLPYGKIADGTPVEVRDPKTGNPNYEKWTPLSNQSIEYSNSGYCLDVDGPRFGNGTKVQLWKCKTGDADQRWIPESNGWLYNPASNKVLDDPSGKVGPQLQIWGANGSFQQDWKIGYVYPPPPPPKPTPKPSPKPTPTPTVTPGPLCTETDNNNANPGNSCPAGSYYNDAQITNTTGKNITVTPDMLHPLGGTNPETIYAYDPGDWKAELNFPESENTQNIVSAFPDTKVVWSGTEGLNNFSEISSVFQVTQPTSPTAADFALGYDITLTYPADDGYPVPGFHYPLQVVIWTDNHGLTPPGALTGQQFGLNGRIYSVYFTPGVVDSVYLVDQQGETSGTLDIHAILLWLSENGYKNSAGTVFPYASDPVISQLDFGWQVAWTQGLQTFSVSKYTQALACVSGTACYK